MYFLIGRWGHGDAAGAALTFFVYTLAGSLAILLAILAMVLVVEPMTFAMRYLIAAQSLAGMDLSGGLVLLRFVLGFAVKTPLVLLYTWLPPPSLTAPRPTPQSPKATVG